MEQRMNEAKVRAKIEAQVKREIQDMLVRTALGRYRGTVLHGGHNWPYEITLVEVRTDVTKLEIEWDE